MEDQVKQRVYEILNEKAAMGGARPKKGRTVKPLTLTTAKQRAAFKVLESLGFDKDEIACIVRNSGAQVCGQPWNRANKKFVQFSKEEETCAAELARLRALEKKVCTNSSGVYKENLKALRSKKGSGVLAGELVGGKQSQAQMKARELFAKRARRVAKLRREGYTQKQAWAVVMDETSYKKARGK